MGRLWGMDSSTFGLLAALVTASVMLGLFYIGAVMQWNLLIVSIAGALLGWGMGVGAAKIFIRWSRR